MHFVTKGDSAMHLNKYGALCSAYKNFAPPCSTVRRSVGWVVLMSKGIDLKWVTEAVD